MFLICTVDKPVNSKNLSAFYLKYTDFFHYYQLAHSRKTNSVDFAYKFLMYIITFGACPHENIVIPMSGLIISYVCLH